MVRKVVGTGEPPQKPHCGGGGGEVVLQGESSYNARYQTVEKNAEWGSTQHWAG
jgi:hypothetical protein